MATWRLNLVEPPAAEPVSLDQAKNHLRIDFPDDDALITGLIQTAREYAETVSARSFVTSRWVYSVDGFPMGGGYYNRDIRRQGPDPSDPKWLPTWNAPVYLPRSPLLGIDKIEYVDMDGDLQELDLGIIRVSLGTPGRVQPQYGKIWPFTLPVNDAVKVYFTAGYGDDVAKIPASVSSAMLLIIGDLYENREDTPSAAVLSRAEKLLGVVDWGGGYA